MKTIASSQELGQQIEKLIRDHLESSRQVVELAIKRAFATAPAIPVGNKSKPARAVVMAKDVNRTPSEMSAATERLYKEVCENPGETMVVIAAKVGMSARELHRPMTRLKRSGRVRSAGARNFTRYFPMGGEKAAE
jgi:hypothetical protein